MNLYHVPATGTRESTEGIHPDFGDDVEVGDWAGVYDEESNAYVVRTEDIPGRTPLAEGQDVGFDYSALLSLPAQGSAQPEPIAAEEVAEITE